MNRLRQNSFAPHIYSLATINCANHALFACSQSPTATATLVHSLVTSTLDYCSCLYAALAVARLSFLDRDLRSATRLIGSIPIFDHISGQWRIQNFGSEGLNLRNSGQSRQATLF